MKYGINAFDTDAKTDQFINWLHGRVLTVIQNLSPFVPSVPITADKIRKFLIKKGTRIFDSAKGLVRFVYQRVSLSGGQMTQSSIIEFLYGIKLRLGGNVQRRYLTSKWPLTMDFRDVYRRTYMAWILSLNGRIFIVNGQSHQIVIDFQS